MLGMMNVSADSPIDVYASQRQSSLYKPRKKHSREYINGRVFVDGVPCERATADNMWQELLKRSVAKDLKEKAATRDTGAMALIRRLSSRLTRTLSGKEEVEEEEEKIDEKVLDDVVEEAKFVTLIKIDDSNVRDLLQEELEHLDTIEDVVEELVEEVDEEKAKPPPSPTTVVEHF